MGALIIDKIPEDVRKRFKLYCLENDISMRDLIIFLMENVPKGNILPSPIDVKPKKLKYDDKKIRTSDMRTK